MSENNSIDCPECKLPILNVSPIQDNGSYSGYNGMVCPFCGHRFDGSKAVADNLSDGLLIGWRGNDIRYGANGPEIWSPVCPLLWEPGETQVATCHGVPLAECKHRKEGDKAPAPNCSCGFYAARTQDHILSLGYGRNSDPLNPEHIVTEVVQSGRVQVHSLGWKAEKARIHRIHVPHVAWKVANDLKALWEPHGVEVVLTDNDNLPKAVVPEWCDGCGAKMVKRELTCEFCGHVNKPITGEGVS